jgi:predicted transcriptional regulator
VLSLSQSTKKKAACSDLLSCLYGLNEIDYKIFYTLSDKEDKSLDQIALEVKRNRTTVYKNLQKLTSWTCKKGNEMYRERWTVPCFQFT